MGTNGATKRFGYVTDVGDIKFDDATLSSWIQLMPIGSYNHVLHGKIDITPQKVQKFVENFRKNVRGITLDVDYDHKAHDGKAAGWIQDIQDRGFDGLWGLVKWTQPAYQSLKAGEYKYFSPEFQDEWEHPQTGQTFEDVLFGGAITNRPFLKDIQPINLHEVIRASEGGPVVDPKKLRQMLGLKEDATEEEVEKALAKVAQATNEPDPATPPTPPAPTPPAPPPGEPAPGSGDQGTPAPATPKEPVLASETAAVKQLTEQMAAMQKQLDEQAAARRLSEVKLGFAQMTEGKKFALAPAVVNKAQQLTVQLSEDKGNTFMGLLKEILDGGLVELGERGGRPVPTAGNADPRKMLDELVTKKLTESQGKLQYVDALELVYAENPSLYESYRQGQLGGV
jgi:Mu-like prophage I protein